METSETTSTEALFRTPIPSPQTQYQRTRQSQVTTKTTSPVVPIVTPSLSEEETASSLAAETVPKTPAAWHENPQVRWAIIAILSLLILSLLMYFLFRSPAPPLAPAYNAYQPPVSGTAGTA